ncbi:MAG: NAD-binding protein, partial [Myxococcota bacterium]
MEIKESTFVISERPVRRVATALVIVLVIFFGGSLGYWILGKGQYSPGDCLYMTVNAVCTVGFREVIPVSGDGVMMAYTTVLILVGAGSMLYLLSMLTAFMVEGDLKEMFRRRRMNKDIARLKDHYIVCGVGRSGEHAILQMNAHGLPLVLVDLSEKTLWEFQGKFNLSMPYIFGDASDENVLIKAGVERAKGLIASLPEDQDNIFLVLTARQLNPSLRIVSKVNEQSSRKKLMQVGADAVVSPAEIGGRSMFNELTRPEVTSFLENLMHDAGENLMLDKVDIASCSYLAGKKLSETDIRRRFNLLVVGIQTADQSGFI